MVSVHSFVEAAQHAVGVGTDSNAKQSCPTHNRNSATAFLLGQSDRLVRTCIANFPFTSSTRRLTKDDFLMIPVEGFVTVATFSLYGGREWSTSGSASSVPSSSSSNNIPI